MKTEARKQRTSKLLRQHRRAAPVFPNLGAVCQGDIYSVSCWRGQRGHTSSRPGNTETSDQISSIFPSHRLHGWMLLLVPLIGMQGRTLTRWSEGCQSHQTGTYLDTSPCLLARTILEKCFPTYHAVVEITLETCVGGYSAPIPAESPVITYWCFPCFSLVLPSKWKYVGTLPSALFYWSFYNSTTYILNFIRHRITIQSETENIRTPDKQDKTYDTGGGTKQIWFSNGLI